jgi:hypothetical protein
MPAPGLPPGQRDEYALGQLGKEPLVQPPLQLATPLEASIISTA